MGTMTRQMASKQDSGRMIYMFVYAYCGVIARAAQRLSKRAGTIPTRQSLGSPCHWLFLKRGPDEGEAEFFTLGLAHWPGGRAARLGGSRLGGSQELCVFKSAFFHIRLKIDYACYRF